MGRRETAARALPRRAVRGDRTCNRQPVGVDIIVQQMHVPAFNAISSPAALGDSVIESIGLGTKAAPPVQPSERAGTHVRAGRHGYVAGELLAPDQRHPQLKLAAVMSDSQPAKRSPRRSRTWVRCWRYALRSQQAIEAQLRTLRAPAIFSAAPHGVSAGLIDQLLAVAEQAGSSRAWSTSRPIFATRAQQLTRPCTSTPPAPRAWRSSPAPCQSTSRTLPRGTWRTGLLCDRPHCSPRYVAGSGLTARSCSSRQ